MSSQTPTSSEKTSSPLDVAAYFSPEIVKRDVKRASTMAQGLVGSEILKIAAEIRAMIQAGHSVANLTVGDFDPKQFPIPAALKTAIQKTYEGLETNYPPSTGMPQLRQAVADFYKRELGLSYPESSVLIASGARPIIYGTYRTVVDPGDEVVFGAPSWNNEHYVHMLGAKSVVLNTTPENGFLLSAKDVLPTLKTARLVCLNTPSNPTGTVMGAADVKAIAEAVVAENRNRQSKGERPCYLMYDHIYWLLTAEGTRHVTPIELCPESAAYTFFVDGISKGFAATGLRVGWALGPSDLMAQMSSVIGHVGAWAPRPEQVATAAFLNDHQAVHSFLQEMKQAVNVRLSAVHEGFEKMKAEGLPVRSLKPEGAIYVTVQIAPFGKKTKDGATLKNSEDVRLFLLKEAAVGLVPFRAFGFAEDSGWFRISIGAVSLSEIHGATSRISQALSGLS